MNTIDSRSKKSLEQNTRFLHIVTDAVFTRVQNEKNQENRQFTN